MELEHCSRPVGAWKFTTSNYSVNTTPQDEWGLVLRAGSSQEALSGTTSAAFADSGSTGRRMPSFANLMKLDLSKKAGLTQAEVIAVILYTGPMVSLPCLQRTHGKFFL
jgi:hypothetical protein